MGKSTISMGHFQLQTVSHYQRLFHFFLEVSTHPQMRSFSMPQVSRHFMVLFAGPQQRTDIDQPFRFHFGSDHSVTHIEISHQYMFIHVFFIIEMHFLWFHDPPTQMISLLNLIKHGKKTMGTCNGQKKNPDGWLQTDHEKTWPIHRSPSKSQAALVPLAFWPWVLPASSASAPITNWTSEILGETESPLVDHGFPHWNCHLGECFPTFSDSPRWKKQRIEMFLATLGGGKKNTHLGILKPPKEHRMRYILTLGTVVDPEFWDQTQHVLFAWTPHFFKHTYIYIYIYGYIDIEYLNNDFSIGYREMLRFHVSLVKDGHTSYELHCQRCKMGVSRWEWPGMTSNSWQFQLESCWILASRMVSG